MIDDAIQFRFQLYRERAKGKGRKFELGFQEFKTLVLGDCAYCGLPADYGARQVYGGEEFRLNGVDRIDNNAGYAPGNVVSCCLPCNVSKGDEPVLAWLGRLHGIAERTRDFPGLIEYRAQSGSIADGKRAADRIRGRFRLQSKRNA